MIWKELISLDQIPKIIDETKAPDVQGAVVFKHSTRCSISFFAKKNFEQDWSSFSDHIPTYYLDLLKYREISDSLADTFQVVHESPQVLVLKNGHCGFSASHHSINVDDILSYLQRD